MPKKFIQRHNKALAEIASKTISVLPFIDDNPEAREERIARTKAEGWDSFSFFCRTYFPPVCVLPFCPVHETMFDETQHSEGIIGITGFRGLGKTVLMGVVYPIWKIIKGERYIIHTAADVDLSQERTAFTLHELTNNRRLLGDFPELQPVDSFDLDFYLKNKTRIRARSIKQSHRGTLNPKTAKRPGLIVCDDIDKEENMGNQSIGKRRMDKITQELAGALAPEGTGKVIWLGNLVHPNYAICQFQQLIIDDLKADNPDLDIVSKQILKCHQRAIMRFPLENPDGSSAWEEQYPTNTLPNLRAKFGSTGYQREMLGQPVIEGNIFKHQWFTKYRNLPAPSLMKRVWMYADPAWGEKGCFKAIISIGYDGNRFYVIHVWIRQTENTKFFRYYHDTYQELESIYKAKFRSAIETSYGQARILADFDRWAKDNNLNPISHRIKRIDNKENKNLRIERTETSIETTKILFPDGQDTPTLISQFLTYPDGYIDGCDALAGCLERFNEYDIGRNRVRIRRFSF
jgi:hypothetical protein